MNSCRNVPYSYRITALRATLCVSIIAVISVIYFTKQRSVVQNKVDISLLFKKDPMDFDNKHTSEVDESLGFKKDSSFFDHEQTSGSALKMADTETRHVAFLKVHKAGSTTSQNIFLRFGVYHNLTFLLPSVGVNNDCNGFVNCISYNHSFTDKNTWPSPSGQSFDIMCSHVIYNRESFKQFLPADTKYIGLVRDPVKRLESAIQFFGLFKKIQLSTYANDPTQYDHFMSNNRMALEFGFDREWFPSKTNGKMTDSVRTSVLNYMNQLNKDFTLIIVVEMYTESLVLMRRLLKWTTKDILYKYRGSQKNRKFQTNDIQKIKEYLHIDYMLYDFAVKELHRKIALAGDDFQDEVKYFKTLVTKVVNHCRGNRSPLVVSSTAWHEQFKVERNLCYDMDRPEIPYFKDIRKWQYGSIDKSTPYASEWFRKKS